MLVKICGLQLVEAAECALDAGATLLGVILVPGRARTVDPDVAREILALVRRRRGTGPSLELLHHAALASDNYDATLAGLLEQHGPFLVGVTRNQDPGDVAGLAASLGLDFVQLHGSEQRTPLALAAYPVPVISRVVPGAHVDDGGARDLVLAATRSPAHHQLVLLDSEAGGEGKTIDWNATRHFHETHGAAYLLAGGLTPSNVQEALAANPGAVGVDVSGGVETAGVKDLAKIAAFVRAARGE